MWRKISSTTQATGLVGLVEQVDEGVRGPLRAAEQPDPRRHGVAGAQLAEVGHVVLRREARVPVGQRPHLRDARPRPGDSSRPSLAMPM